MDEARTCFHPSFRIQQPASLPHGGWHEGFEAFGRMAATFGEHWTRTFDPEFRISGDDQLVVQVTTQTWTSKATGKEATVDVVELFSFTDGLISEIKVFQQDTHALLETLH